MKLTKELLLKFGFNEISHYTVMGALVKPIGRNRYLSIGCVGTPNEMLWIQNVEGCRVTDLVCLWNYDYDGILELEQLDNIYFALTKKHL